MGDKLAEAKDLIAQADKRKNQSGGLFGFMKDSSEKFEEASELYRQAANKLKLAKEWKEAGDAYVKSADCQTKCKAAHEACKDLGDASACYKKINSPLAVEMLERAVTMCLDMGRHGQAAKHSQTIAEHYEAAADLEKALEYYQHAADYFDSEDSSGSNASKMRIKVAQISAQLDQFEKAAELYEGVARSMIDNHLLKFSAKEYYLKAGLCRMASGDSIGAAQAAVNYNNEFAAFKDTREEKFLKNILQAAGEADADAYTAIVQEYDAISRLDAWMTSILLKIKKQMSSDDIL